MDLSHGGHLTHGSKASISGKYFNACFYGVDPETETIDYEKAMKAGAGEVWLTERGNMYGYNNLVVDFRNIPDMLGIASTVVMDCTHSVQRPGAAGGKTGGNREFVPAMARAARAFGANGFFFEVHPDPDHALSDGPNMLYLNDLENVIKSLL